MPRIVARKFTPPETVPTPLTINPKAQRSVAALRAKVCSVNGASANQPMAGAPPLTRLEYTKIPPKNVAQKPIALIRGKAMSRAPIISGTR